jgi:hypothetical protein
MFSIGTLENNHADGGIGRTPQVAIVKPLKAQIFVSLLIASLWSLKAQASPQADQSTAPAAQEQAASSGRSKQEQKSEQEKNIERQEQSQRVLGVIPQFGVTSRQNAPPLTGGEKFHLFYKSAFDPAILAIVGLQAGISQAEDEFPGYGQRAQGYAKRYGASFADQVSSGFWSNYFYPVLFKEDPRYFRLGEGGAGKRLLYSVKQEFVCHTDRGGRSFAFSNVLGAFTSGAISNAYYPGRTLIRTIPGTPTSPAIPVYESDRGVTLTLSRAAIALGYGTIGGLFDEFWPDIHQKLFGRKSSETAHPNQPAPLAPVRLNQE